MGRSMDWTLEDNMVNGSVFCATPTSRRSGHTPFVQTGAETSGTRVEAIESKSRCQLRIQEVCSGWSIIWCSSGWSFRLFPNNWKVCHGLRPHSGYDTARCSWQCHSRRVFGVSGMKVRSLVVHSNFSAFHRTSVFVVRWTHGRRKGRAGGALHPPGFWNY